MVTEDRFEQLEELSRLTGSSISRIVRLTLDSQAEKLAQAIHEIKSRGGQKDVYQSAPAPKKEATSKNRPTKRAEQAPGPTGRKPITDDSFANLIKKQKNR